MSCVTARLTICCRSFATRLARQVLADLLQTLMRHADLKTTRVHYAEVNAEEQAERFWHPPISWVAFWLVAPSGPGGR